MPSAFTTTTHAWLCCTKCTAATAEQEAGIAGHNIWPAPPRYARTGHAPRRSEYDPRLQGTQEAAPAEEQANRPEVRAKISPPSGLTGKGIVAANAAAVQD